MLRSLLLLGLVLATTASFVGGRGPVGGVRTAVTRSTDAVRRCVPPLAQFGNDDSSAEQWDSWDDAALAEHVARRASVARCGHPSTVLSGLESAYVLIFNVGMHNEGVYTLQGRATRAAAYVLAFEFKDDADRFASLLQAESFDMATPYRWGSDQLESFCDAGEFEVSLVPQGALITPPNKNEYDLEAFDRVLNGGGGGEEAPEPDAPDAYASQRAAFERLFNEGA